MSIKGKYRSEFYDKNGDINRKKECIKIINHAFENIKLIDFYMKGGVMYAALKQDNQINGIVVTTSVRKKELLNFSYELFLESEFPHHFDCPDFILNQLTITNNEESNKWRGKCKQVNNFKYIKKSLDALPVGTEIMTVWNFSTIKLVKTIVPPLKKPIWYDGSFRYDPMLISEHGYDIVT